MDRSKFEAFFYFLGFEVSIDIIPGTDLLLVIIINFVAFLTFHKPIANPSVILPVRGNPHLLFMIHWFICR
jgi:hypothetical protein